MIISFSELYKYDTCPRQYWYRFIKGFAPIEESGAMATGTKGHQLLQSFYTEMQEGKTKDEALAITHDRAKAMISQDKLDFQLLTAYTLVDNYIRANEFKPQAVIVENRFLIPASEFTDDPLFEDVQFGFTPDVVFERTGGFQEVEDAKFIQRAWPKSKINRFPQAKLYQIFLNKMGYNVTRTSIRFFNVKTGVVTKQDYSLTRDEEFNLISDFLGGAADILSYRKVHLDGVPPMRRTMNYGACQFCAFEYVCTLDAEGKDSSRTLKTEFKKSDYSYEA